MMATMAVLGFLVGFSGAWIVVSGHPAYRWAYLIGVLAGVGVGVWSGVAGNREHEFIQRTSGR